MPWQTSAVICAAKRLKLPRFGSYQSTGQFSALGKMAVFPAFMLVCYLALIAYFKTKGGYKPVQLSGGGGGAH